MGLPKFVDDTVTDYSRPTPSIDVSKDVSDEQKAIWKSNSASFSEQGGSVGNVVSKPMIRFIKETGCPSVSKVNNTEKSRKPTVKYAEMYRNTSQSPRFDCKQYTWVDKGKTWTRVNHDHDNMKYPSTSTLNSAHPKMTSVVEPAHSHIKRPFERKTTAKNKVWVPTVRTKFPTVGLKVPTVKPTVAADNGNKGKVVKPSARWIWKPKQNLLDQGSNLNGVSGIPRDNIDDKGYWDNGCSRHMTGNISYLSEYEPFNGGYVSFGHGGGKITGKGTIKTACKGNTHSWQKRFRVKIWKSFFLEASHIRYALMVRPTVYVAHIQQFWSTARVETVDEATKIIATVNGRQRTLTESSIKRHLKLNDAEGISTLPDTDLFANLSLMGYNILPNQRFSFQKGQFSHQWKFLIHTIMQCLSPKSTSFNEFSSNIATAIVCLATNRVYKFSKIIFDGMVRNIKSKGKFLMYPRFIEQCLKMSQFGVNKKSAIYDVPFHTPKVFSTLRVNSPSFFGRTVPLFDSMIVTQGEGSENPTEPHHTPSAQDEPTPQHDQTTSQEPQQQETTIPSPSPSDIPIHRRLTKGTIRISQSKVPSPGADETASPSGDDRHGEAFPTATSLDAGQDRENIAKTSAMPHEASPRVTSLGGGEGSMQQQLMKLIDICTSLQRQHSLMAEKIQSQDLEIIQLKTRIKTLKDNERRREGFAQEDAPNTGGMDQGEDLVEKSTDKGSESVSPAVATARRSFPLLLILPLPVCKKDKGKRIMTEPEKPSKEKVLDQMSAQLAKELEEEFALEDQRIREQAERDSEIAKIHAQQELDMMIAELVRSNEMVAKHLSGYEQDKAELSHNEKVELINELLKYQRDLAQIKKYQAQQSKITTKTERRIWEKIQEFVPMDSKLESERLKRPGIQLAQKSSKKLKTAKASGSELSQEQQTKEPKELSEEELKKMMEIVPAEEIVRVGDHTEVYQLFEEMLRKFDREDLDKLWSLVKETFSTTDPTEDKEKMLWVELKRLYEPDPRDQLWALQKYMHDPLEWKLDMRVFIMLSTGNGDMRFSHASGERIILDKRGNSQLFRFLVIEGGDYGKESSGAVSFRLGFVVCVARGMVAAKADASSLFQSSGIIYSEIRKGSSVRDQDIYESCSNKLGSTNDTKE
ncbi:hypothetical protein Tco_0303958 [Tanacetum coccineum]